MQHKSTPDKNRTKGRANRWMGWIMGEWEAQCVIDLHVFGIYLCSFGCGDPITYHNKIDSALSFL